jgi:hypothetical protein
VRITLRRALLLAVLGIAAQILLSFYSYFAVTAQPAAWRDMGFVLQALLGLAFAWLHPATLAVFLYWLYLEMDERAKGKARKAAAWVAIAGAGIAVATMLAAVIAASVSPSAVLSARALGNLALAVVGPGVLWILLLFVFATKDRPFKAPLVRQVAGCLFVLEAIRALRFLYEAAVATAASFSSPGLTNVSWSRVQALALGACGLAAMLILLFLLWRGPQAQGPPAEIQNGAPGLEPDAPL